MLRGIERFGSAIFWSGLYIVLALGVIYLITGFTKRHFAGTIFGNAAQAVENFSEPH